jgi:molybdopterin-guanine dinucleotide biosynthesis protein A
LAGGESRRLGLDKAHLLFGGRPLLHIVAGRLAEVCAEVIVVASPLRPPEGIPDGARLAMDGAPGLGPLAGIQAGLKAASFPFALVAACDMPFLSPPLLRYMAGLPRSYEALVPEWDGRRHPLHAIYSRACLPTIDALLEAGQRSVEELLARVRLQVLGEEEVRRWDPEGLSLFNLNERQDLTVARRLWRGR